MRHLTATLMSAMLLIALYIGFPGAAESTSASRPDLAVVGLLDPPSVGQEGMEFSTVMNVKNLGRGHLRARTRIGVYLERGNQSIRIARLWRAGVRSGSTATKSLRVLIPGGLVVGQTYQLAACADDAKRVRETSERNNCRKSSRLMFVQSRP